MSSKEVRLIDAEQYRKALKSEMFQKEGENRLDIQRAIILLDMTPTIVPERLRPRGKWERVGGDTHRSGYAVWCTNCGKYHFVHYRGSLGGLYGHDELFIEPPKCPNCGAIMEVGNV